MRNLALVWVLAGARVLLIVDVKFDFLMANDLF
jgi:hypothetical protein